MATSDCRDLAELLPLYPSAADIPAPMSVFWFPSLLANPIAGRSASLNVSNTDAIALYEIIRNQPSADSEA